MINLRGQKVLLTGANSMIGRQVITKLLQRGAEPYCVFGPSFQGRLSKGDEELLNQVHWRIGHLQVEQFYPFRFTAPDAVEMQHVNMRELDYCIHLAGYNGGIEFNRKYPRDIYRLTTLMAINTLDIALLLNVKKCVSVVASCSHPDQGDAFLEEKNLWNGKSNDSVECHGLAKRTLDAYSRQIFKQFNVPFVTATLTNCYGPGDRFDEERGKVVSGLIRKFYEAKQKDLPFVECWGTGKPLREFMYCADAAEGIIQTLEKYDDPMMTLNLGSDIEVSIKELVELISSEVGYTGEIRWLTEKGDGQLRKKLDTTRMRSYVKIDPFVSIEDGIHKTVEWYKEQQCSKLE